MTIRDSKGSRAAKAKGRDAENAVVEYLRKQGIPAERRRLMGVADLGDISGMLGVVIEVKNEKKIRLAGYIEELKQEVDHADQVLHYPMPKPGSHKGVVVIKKRGTSDAGKWYAVMEFSQAVDLLR